MARRLKLNNIPEYSELSGGQAIELAASKATNSLQFNFTATLLRYRDCNFSLAGIKNQMFGHIRAQEKQLSIFFNNCYNLKNVKFNVLGLPPDAILPDLCNLCAGFQLIITRHLCQRVQRGIHYATLKNLIPSNRQTLVTF